MNTRVNGDTIERILKLNDRILDHLTLEENCVHPIRQIVSEAFVEEN